MTTREQVEDAWGVTLPPQLDSLRTLAFDSFCSTEGKLVPLPAPVLSLDEVLQAKSVAEDWKIPTGLVPIIGDFHDLVCLDYRQSHVPAVVVINDDRAESRIFDSFDEFVKALSMSPSDRTNRREIIEGESFLDF